ncbi:hypothetical protein T492DRAFT_938152 [Pavlovales sp. CCMP2436]|nr:hypothetical protein T492DRAFT_938152 [Pavlovales sp. CCMP2436]
MRSYPPLSRPHYCTLSLHLTIGTNIGVQLRKLYQPEYYPGALVLNVFDHHFGTARQNDSGLCAFGFEANPTHNARLETIESAYRRAGHRMTISRETAVGTSNGTTTFFFTGNAFRDLGASTKLNNFLNSSATMRPISRQIRTIDFAHFLHSEIFSRSEAGLPGAAVVMKLDIEGSEESLLPWLRSCGAFCGIDVATIEFHHWMHTKSQAQSKAAYLLAVGEYLGTAAARTIREEAAARGERLAFKTTNMDDDTYRFDNGAVGMKRTRRVPIAPLPRPLTKHD